MVRMRCGGSGIRCPWQWPQTIAERSESSRAGFTTESGGSAGSLRCQRYRVTGESARCGMLARRSVTGATGDAQFRHLRVPRFVNPVEVRLGLHVVAEDAVHIPFRDVLFVIASIGKKKRSVEVHPAALDQIVGDGQANPGVAVLRQILLDSPGTDGAHDFELLLLAIRTRSASSSSRPFSRTISARTP